MLFTLHSPLNYAIGTSYSDAPNTSICLNDYSLFGNNIPSGIGKGFHMGSGLTFINMELNLEYTLVPFSQVRLLIFWTPNADLSLISTGTADAAQYVETNADGACPFAYFDYPPIPGISTYYQSLKPDSPVYVYEDANIGYPNSTYTGTDFVKQGFAKSYHLDAPRSYDVFDRPIFGSIGIYMVTSLPSILYPGGVTVTGNCSIVYDDVGPNRA